MVAWELLTGARLFRKASDAETLRALTEQAITPPSTARPGLPPALDAIVLRALERDPTRRYASAREFGADLWAFMCTQPQLPQHRELADWMHGLFPGEHEQILRRLDSFPASVPPLENESRQVQRSLRLLKGLRGRVGGALPVRPRARVLATALVAAIVVGLGVFRWSAGKPHGIAQAEPIQSSPGFIVEVERSPRSREVVVHVRPTPEPDQLRVAR